MTPRIRDEQAERRAHAEWMRNWPAGPRPTWLERIVNRIAQKEEPFWLRVLMAGIIVAAAIATAASVLQLVTRR